MTKAKRVYAYSPDRMRVECHTGGCRTEKRLWVLGVYVRDPNLHLDEAAWERIRKSVARISRNLRRCGL